MREFYVYIHRKMDTGEIFYVGKGKGSRYKDSSSRNKHWKHIVNKHGFAYEIIKDKLTEEEALSIELDKINDIGIDNLSNIVLGGKGASGWKHSDSAKKAISLFNKGKKLKSSTLEKMRVANLGKKLTDKHRLKLSLAKKGKARKPLSEDTKRKISLSHIGIRPGKETLIKLRESHLGQRKGSSNNMFDNKNHIFYNDKYGLIVCKQYIFKKIFSMTDVDTSSLIKNKVKKSKNWIYKGEKIWQI